MTMATLSPNSILASPSQVNPQVRHELQGSLSQAAQDAQRTSKTAQTDTITISAQALRMADGKSIESRKTANKTDKKEPLQRSQDKAGSAKSGIRRNAMKAYEDVAVNN